MSITNKIHFRNLKGDIFGGVTAAVIALPMALTFGVASGAGASNDYQALVLHLSEVPILGVTSALALENAIKEASEKERQVFLVGVSGQTEKRLRKLGVMDKVPPENIFGDRTTALQQAVNYVNRNLVDFGSDTADSQAIA
jgi:SulP family sulfate permease